MSDSDGLDVGLGGDIPWQVRARPWRLGCEKRLFCVPWQDLVVGLISESHRLIYTQVLAIDYIDDKKEKAAMYRSRTCIRNVTQRDIAQNR